jgi:VanZ family protein
LVRIPEAWFRLFWAVLTFAAAAFILWESTRSRGDPTLPELTTDEAYLGHLAVYAALGFCAQTAALTRRWGTLVAVVAIAGLFGVAIEAYQSTIDGREASAYDALANLAGATIGAAIAYALTLRWQPLLRDA